MVVRILLSVFIVTVWSRLVDSTTVLFATIVSSLSWISVNDVSEVPNPQFSGSDFVNVSVPLVENSPGAELSYVNEAVLDIVLIPTWPRGNNKSLSSGLWSNTLAWLFTSTKSAIPLCAWLVCDNVPEYSVPE